MVIMALKGEGQISAGYAVIPALITVVSSAMVVINAKDYVRTVQKKK